MSNLFDASSQWRKRPPDERMESIQALYDHAYARFKSAVTVEVPYRSLTVAPTDNDDVVLLGPKGPATFTNYSFGQLNRAIGTPASYLATLEAPLMAQLMNRSLQKREPDDTGHVLLHRNGSDVFRAVTGKVYNRYWNWQVAKFLLELIQASPGWRLPPARPAFPNQPGTRPATEADVLDMNSTQMLSVGVGDLIAPAGAYESASELFVFMVNQDRVLMSGKEVLNRGFFVRNSEVGDASLVFTRFLHDYVCGNHIVWGARDVTKLSFAHVGKDLPTRIAEAMKAIRTISDESAEEDTAKLKKLRTFLLGDDKSEVVRRIAESKRFNLSKEITEAAYDLAETHCEIHGDPKSAWGFVSGLTRLSQESEYTDRRTELDRVGGKILQLAA